MRSNQLDNSIDFQYCYSIAFLDKQSFVSFLVDSTACGWTLGTFVDIWDGHPRLLKEGKNDNELWCSQLNAVNWSIVYKQNILPKCLSGIPGLFHSCHDA